METETETAAETYTSGYGDVDGINGATVLSHWKSVVELIQAAFRENWMVK